MPATKVKCVNCGKYFYARKDAIYCSYHCRSEVRQQDAKIETPEIPKSGVPGITFKRINQYWTIKIKLDDGSWKYIGSKKLLPHAIAFQKRVLSETETGEKGWHANGKI